MVARQRVAEDDHSSSDAADGHQAHARHPLDRLGAREIARAVEILRRERPVTPEARFVSVTLNEPRKDQIAFAAPVGPPAGGQPAHPGHSAPRVAAVPREAFVVLLEPQQHNLRGCGVSHHRLGLVLADGPWCTRSRDAGRIRSV